MWFTARLAPGPYALESLAEARLDWLIQQIATAPLLEQTRRLYCADWRYRALNADRLREHVQRGEVLSLPGTEAWAIMTGDEEAGGVWLGYADGPERDLVALLQQVRALPARRADGEVLALFPRGAAIAQRLRDAGYTEVGHEELCYEWSPPSSALS
jgi:hypothetical protein